MTLLLLDTKFFKAALGILVAGRKITKNINTPLKEHKSQKVERKYAALAEKSRKHLLVRSSTVAQNDFVVILDSSR